MAHRTARALALAALNEWRQSRGFADAVVQRLLAASALAGSDRAFATELSYGVLRHLMLLDFLISILRPGRLDADSRDLLRLGLYQLFCLRTPGHAAVFETVALAAPRKRSFINAILRSAQRRRDELETALAAAPLATRSSHPEFLIRRWTKAFGEKRTTELCEWNNLPAPIYARVNKLKTTAAQFQADHPASEALPEAPGFFRLAGLPLEALAQGHCYIQDPSTRIACELLGAQPGETIMDACAAPGGKTGLLAQSMANRGELVSCDRDPVRIETLRENLTRLGATMARTLRHDWRSGPLPQHDGPVLFDRILVDAPCTNTGVLRRRVDLRWRLTPEDFARMQGEQEEILRAIVPHLRPGGTLVYATCSIEPEENEEVLERALQESPFMEVAETRSLLPFRDRCDGAFAARLTSRLDMSRTSR